MCVAGATPPRFAPCVRSQVVVMAPHPLAVHGRCGLYGLLGT